MKRGVIWSKTARDDYQALTRAIARENPDAAERVAGDITRAVAALADFATGRAGRMKDTYEKVLPGLPYILAYEIVGRPAGGEMVAILHIIHAARDWQPGKWPAQTP